MPTMSSDESPGVGWAVVPCSDLSAEIAFFTEQLGLQLRRISPADDPRVAEVCGRGLRLRLRRQPDVGPIELALEGPGPEGDLPLTSPAGHRACFEDPAAASALPPNAPELVLSRAGDESAWGVGRAGMQYRDLIPGRYGGRFIASHIRIPTGGPVPDHVHFHAIRFQLIHCVRGWVRLVYEDQGEPFVMHAGECVLQPPHIRHRVLESSDGLEVVEIACPAEHDTFLDHGLELPTARVLPERDFHGQRFVHPNHNAAEWALLSGGLRQRDLGVAAATDGLASAALLSPVKGKRGTLPWGHHGELRFGFVSSGSWTVRLDGESEQRLDVGDSIALPPATSAELSSESPAAELLEVRVAPESGTV